MLVAVEKKIMVSNWVCRARYIVKIHHIVLLMRDTNNCSKKYTIISVEKNK